MNNSNTNANNANEVSVEDFILQSQMQERNEKYPPFKEEDLSSIKEHNLRCIKNSKYSIDEI